MTKTLAIIGARLNSSRLPGKHLLPLSCDDKEKTKPLISHILCRLKQSALINNIELATTADEFNQPLIKWAREHDVPCFPFDGDVNDLMGRLDKIIQREAPDFIVYICGDCPLIAPDFIDHALKNLKATEKDTIKLFETVQSLHEGMAFYSRKGWDKLMSVSISEKSREHVGYADRINPVLDTLYINDNVDYSKVKHRISVDTHADYRFMAELYRRWYLNHSADSIVNLEWVQQQLITDPDLAAINAHVQQKAPDRQYAQIDLYCHVSQAVGTGHLRRCSFIAEALQEKLGCGTRIFVKGTTVDLPWLKTTACWFDSDQALIHQIQQDQNSLIIIDFHPDHIDMKSLQQACIDIRLQGKKILALDKLVTFFDYVDKVFIPGFYSKVQNPKVSFGWQNYLFDKITPLPKKQQILILTGGSDALGYGQTLPALLEQVILPDWEYIWVRGPLAPEPNLHNTSKIKIIHNPTNLPELMATASIVLSCYGLSLFESISAQAATILLPTKHLCDQEELDALKTHKVCLITLELNESIYEMVKLQTNPDLQKFITTNAAHLTENNGITNLIKIIQSLLS